MVPRNSPIISNLGNFWKSSFPIRMALRRKEQGKQLKQTEVNPCISRDHGNQDPFIYTKAYIFQYFTTHIWS